MTQTLKNKAFLLLGILGLIALLLTSTRFLQIRKKDHTTHTLTATSQALNAEQFVDSIDTLMTNTWNQLESEAGVTHDDCKEYLEKYAQSIKAEIKKSNEAQKEQFDQVHTKTIALVHEILNDFALSAQDVDIIAMKSGSPAGANAYSLYIDEKCLNSFSPEAQRFIIAHEISHIKNKDNLTETALINLLNTDNKAHSACLDTFTRSIEFRADTEAMLRNSTYTNGGIAFLTEYIKRYGDTYTPTHPRPSDRLKIAHNIDQMHRSHGDQSLKRT